MLNQSQLDNLNILPINTLRNDYQKNLTDTLENPNSYDQMNNLILNSNLENGSSIK